MSSRTSLWTRAASRLHVLTLGLVLGALAPILRAADVRTVGPTGDFVDIQSAVNAALDGDILLVTPGNYLGLDIRNKSLTVVVDGGGVATLLGDLRIRDLAPQRTVVVVGLAASPVSANFPGLTVDNCFGSVRIVDCAFDGRTSVTGPASGGARIVDSADVSLRDCQVRGGTTLVDDDPGPPAAGPPGLEALRSSLVVHGGSISGGSGTRGGAGEDGSSGGPGLRVDDAVVLVSGGGVAGGTGGAGGDCQAAGVGPAGGAGGPGVVITGGGLFRAQDTSPAGGAGGPGALPGPVCAAGGPAGSTGAALSTPSGSSVSIAGVAPALVAQTPIREFESFSVSLQGEPGSLAALLSSVSPASSWQPAALGQLLVDPSFSLRIVGPIPAGGSLDLVTAFPDLGPGIEGVRLFTQPLLAAPSGVLTLGSPFTAIVVDASF